MACDDVTDWWTTPSCELRPERTVSAVLVPVLLVLAVGARVGKWCSYRNSVFNWPDSTLSTLKPVADVAFVVGMGIQAQDYVTHEDAQGADSAWMWILSTVAHLLLVPAFAGAEVRLPGVVVAALVYGLSLAILGGMHGNGPGDNRWPYSLSPLVCLAFVLSYLVQHAGDAVADARGKGSTLQQSLCEL